MSKSETLNSLKCGQCTHKTANDVERSHIEQDLDILVFDETYVFPDLWKLAGSQAFCQIVSFHFRSGLICESDSPSLAI